MIQCYVGRKKGKMKAFDTEKEAMEYTEDSVALYKGKSNDNLTFVCVIGIKATAEECTKILENS